MKTIKTLLVGLVLGAFVPPQASAMASTAGVATSANQALQLINDGTAILQRLRMIQIQLEQLRKFRKFSDLQWGDAIGTFLALRGVIEQGTALAFTLSNVDQIFRQTFPGYVPPKDFPAAYQTWISATRDSIASSFSAAGFQSKLFLKENVTMETLRSLNGNVSGQTQAVQVGNLIANQMIGQLQKLRQISLVQVQSQSAYMGFQVNKESQIRAAVDQFFQFIPNSGGGGRY